jgi:hypothetical protein
MRPAWIEAPLVALCAAICAVQLLLAGYIGLADNGDFPKVYARFDCGPPDGVARNFVHFVPDYEFGPQYHWVSDVLSSEILLAAGPTLLVKAAGARVFNIRWLGALNVALFLAAFYALLVCLRRRGAVVQIALGLLAIWIFTDVAYLSYFNSFYSDTPAILGLLLMVPLALLLTRDEEPSRAVLWLFAAAAALFITSKMQHGLYGFLPASFALWIGRRRKTARRTALAVCALLLGAEVAAYATTSEDYWAHPLFTAIFFKVLPAAGTPVQALRELGLNEADLRYAGMNAYSEGTPILDRLWIAAFTHRTSYARLFSYWVLHPRQATAALATDLVVNAPMIRAPNLSNFRREDGHPPGALTRRFASWSTLRAWLFVIWPGHIAAWFALLAAEGTIVWRRHPRARPAIAICSGVALMAVLEFVFASLTDAIETYRHLLLFHLLTDVTICFAAAWVVDAAAVWVRRASAR